MTTATNDYIARAHANVTDPVIRWDATEHAVNARLHLPTKADAERVAAMFPKSTKVRAVTLSTHTGSLTGDDYRSVELGTVYFHAGLAATGVTGERNETGLRRWRSFKRTAAKLGMALEYVRPYGNSLSDDDAAAL